MDFRKRSDAPVRTQTKPPQSGPSTVNRTGVSPAKPSILSTARNQGRAREGRTIQVERTESITVLNRIAGMPATRSSVLARPLKRSKPFEPNPKSVRVGRDGVGRREQLLAILGGEIVGVGVRTREGGEAPFVRVMDLERQREHQVLLAGKGKGRGREHEKVSGSEISTLRAWISENAQLIGGHNALDSLRTHQA